MPSLYIAGTASETERARRAMRAARDAGFAVTSTWVDTIESVGSANLAEASVWQRLCWSTEDLAQIADADALWFLVPSLPLVTRGAWVELGYAHAVRKHVVCSGVTSQSIFCALGEEFETDESALVHLKAWAADRRLRVGLSELRRQAAWPHDLGGEGGE